MKRLFLFLVVLARCFGAEIADPNVFLRVPGTHVGIQGGIPTTRTNIINVMDYHASGSAVDTTGTVTSGTNALSVGSATGWSNGMGITVGRKAVLTMTVQSTASAGSFIVKIPMCDPALIGQTYFREYTFPMTGGESTGSIAATVRAYADFIGWTVSGSGNDCIFTCNWVGVRPAGETYGDANVTTAWDITTAGLLSFTGTVTDITGTDFTLSGNASSSVTTGTVSHRDDLAIQAAIAASAPQDIIYMPAGTYICNDNIVMGNGISVNYSNRTLRGAGKALTILEQRYSTLGIKIYQDSNYDWAQQQYAHPSPSSDNLVTDGLTAGNDTITIGDTSAFSEGQTIQLAIDNQYDNTKIAAGAVLPYSEFAFNTLRRPMHRIASKTATTLTLEPPVIFTVDDNLSTHVNFQETICEGIGFEDFTITSRNGPLTVGIQFSQARNCWLKNVGVLLISNYGVELFDCLFMEMRRCTLTGYGRAGTNGAGIPINHTCASLIEDNIIVNIQPPIEVNYSSVGNVVALNLLNAPSYQNLTTNHSAHNSHNLYEGNISAGMVSDSFHGSASNDTLLRNNLSGTDYIFNTYLSPLSVNRYSWYYAFIGNIYGSASNPYSVAPYDVWDFGYPAGGFATGSPTDSLNGDFSPLWNNIGELTTRTSDTAGVITITSGSGDFSPVPNIAFQQLDDINIIHQAILTSQVGNLLTFTNASVTLPALHSTFRIHYNAWYNGGLPEIDNSAKPSWWPSTPGSATVIGNYNANSSVEAIPAAQALAGNTVPDSYYTTKEELEARGVVFGDLAFPTFDPTTPGDLTYPAVWARLPAGYRYLNDDADPDGGGGGSAPPSYSRAAHSRRR